jgi:hypothetical protein
MGPLQENNASHRMRLPNGPSIVAIVLIALLVLLTRGINLSADTPELSAFNLSDTGLLVDEGYKTLIPRNLVLFGQTHWAEADEYGNWFRGSPLTQSLLLLTFHLWDPDIVVARATALIYFFALLLLVLLAHRSRLDTAALVLLAAVLATEPFLFFFSRVALFEVAVGLVVAVGLMLIRSVGTRMLWFPFFLAATVALAGMFLVKLSTVLYLFPAMLALGTLALTKSSPRRALVLGLVAGFVMFAFLFRTYPVWLYRLEIPEFWGIVFGYFSSPLIHWSPWLSGAAWYSLGSIIWRSGGKVFGDPYFVALAATMVGAPALLLLFEYSPPRYYVAIVPVQILVVAYWLAYIRDHGHGWTAPDMSKTVVLSGLVPVTIGLFALAWGAADLLDRSMLAFGEHPGIGARTAVYLILPAASIVGIVLYWSFVRLPSWVRWTWFRVPFIALLMTVISGGYHAGAVWWAPNYTTHEMRNEIRYRVSAGQAIAGDWAPFFALGTNIPAVYTRSGQNDGKTVLRICPSFFVSATVFDEGVMESYRVEAGVDFGEPVRLGHYGTRLGQYAGEVRLYEILYPPGECEQESATHVRAK